MKCPICNAENPPEASNCSQCGFSLGLSESAWPESPVIMSSVLPETETKALPVEPVSLPDETPAAGVDVERSLDRAAETPDAVVTIKQPARPEQKARPSTTIGLWTQRRRKPISHGRNILVVLGAAVGLVIGISWLHNAVEAKDNSFVPLALTVAAVYFLGKYLYELIWARSPSNIFRRACGTTVAEVISKRREEHKDSYGKIYYKHFLTVEFDTESRHMGLEAEVSKRIYSRYATGSKLKVRYATADPAVALLEGE
jgi:hypothetical protein